MAFINTSNAIQNQQQNQNQEVEGVQGNPISVGQSSGGFVSNAGGASSPGVGGPGGGWTNIQAYLKANEGSTGAAQNLQNKANQTFGNEREQSSSQANQAKEQANQNLQTQIGTDKASQLIQQAGQNYNFNNPSQQNDQYSQAVGQIQTAYNQNYNAPTSFTYGMSNEAQNLGGIGDRSQFQNIMANIYGDQAGKPLTSGQRILQNQLDVNNQALANARRDVSQQYNTLSQDVGSLVQDTNQNLVNSEADFRAKQDSLRNYLQNQGDVEMANLNRAESDARNSYNQALNQEAQGNGLNSIFDNLASQYKENGFRDEGSGQYAEAKKYNTDYLNQINHVKELLNRSLGGYDQNISQAEMNNMLGRGADYYKNLFNQDSTFNPASYSTNNQYGPGQGAVDSGQDILKAIDDYFNQGASAYDKFNVDQATKYANTGLENRGNYNAIMDILGQENRLDGGRFDVTGGKVNGTF